MRRSEHVCLFQPHLNHDLEIPNVIRLGDIELIGRLLKSSLSLRKTLNEALFLDRIDDLVVKEPFWGTRWLRDDIGVGKALRKKDDFLFNKKYGQISKGKQSLTHP